MADTLITLTASAFFGLVSLALVAWAAQVAIASF
jgi:hypothetical protein